MEWPQITMIALYGINLGVGLVSHGKPREGNHNFFSFLISTIIAATVLYYGGFWQ